MKILKRGLNKCWGIEQTCTGEGNGGGGCNAKLLVEEDDIFITRRSDYDGDSQFFFTFKCPCCGCTTDISEKRVPERIQQKALEKIIRG